MTVTKDLTNLLSFLVYFLVSLQTNLLRCQYACLENSFGFMVLIMKLELDFLVTEYH